MHFFLAALTHSAAICTCPIASVTTTFSLFMNFPLGFGNCLLGRIKIVSAPSASTIVGPLFGEPNPNTNLTRLSSAPYSGLLRIPMSRICVKLRLFKNVVLDVVAHARRLCCLND